MQLTKALPESIPELHAEMIDAFSQFIPVTDGELFFCS